MGKEGSAARMSDLLRVLLSVESYRPSQGQIARKATLGALLVIVGLGTWHLWEYLKVSFSNQTLIYGLPLFVLVAGIWICFRLNNYQKFADFLIAVEGEMYKVSWPTWPVLVNSYLVVIVLIFMLAFALWMFDVIWLVIFRMIGVAA